MFSNDPIPQSEKMMKTVLFSGLALLGTYAAWKMWKVSKPAAGAGAVLALYAGYTAKQINGLPTTEAAQG